MNDYSCPCETIPGGISVPTTFAAEKLPFGVTVSAVAGHDALICDVAQRRRLGTGVRSSRC